MTKITDKSVWSDQKLNFYLIPNDFELPEGLFCISTMSGNEKKVEKAVIEAFKVSRKEARKYLELELKASVNETKKAFLKLRDFSAGTGEQETDVEAFDQAEVMEKLVKSLSGLIPGAQVEDILGKGKSLDEGLGAFKDKVKDYLNSDEAEQSFKKMADKLRGIAEHLEKGGNTDSIENFIRGLGKDLFSEEQENQKEREERIARSVQDSISSALKNSGFEPFKGMSNE